MFLVRCIGHKYEAIHKSMWQVGADKNAAQMPAIVRKQGGTSRPLLLSPSPDLLLHVLLLVAGPRLLLRRDAPLLLHRRQPLLLLRCWVRLLRLLRLQRWRPPRRLRGRWEQAGATPAARRHKGIEIRAGSGSRGSAATCRLAAVLPSCWLPPRDTACAVEGPGAEVAGGGVVGGAAL